MVTLLGMLLIKPTLVEPVLQQIVYFLIGKKQATQTTKTCSLQQVLLKQLFLIFLLTPNTNIGFGSRLGQILVMDVTLSLKGHLELEHALVPVVELVEVVQEAEEAAEL